MESFQRAKGFIVISNTYFVKKKKKNRSSILLMCQLTQCFHLKTHKKRLFFFFLKEQRHRAHKQLGARNLMIFKKQLPCCSVEGRTGAQLDLLEE